MSPHVQRRALLLGVAALMFNAFTWGVSWWPMRWLQDQGLHPLWTTVLVYLLAVVVISATHPRAWAELLATPALWMLVVASGTTNAAFNWAVTLGDVVRVVLLFYLMPVWAVLLARWLLHEPLTAPALGRVALALAGAMVVLWPEGGGLPVPHTAADALAVVGGFAFALNNVMLRRESARSAPARALAMFFGGVAVAGALAFGLQLNGLIQAPPQAAWPWLSALVALAICFLLSNLALQVGAARLRANVTAVVMITEVVFAGVSAVLLGASQPTWALLMGGSLIVAAAVLAAWQP